MFFQDSFGLIRVLLVGSLAYIALVFLLRVSGKRTLSKMNAFDLIITVAPGSTLTTVLLSKDVPETDGSFSVISGNEKANSTLRNVDGIG